MSFDVVRQSVSPYIPSRNEIVDKISDSIPTIVQNIKKIALPALALYALSNAQVAEGGFITYYACVHPCVAYMGPAMHWCLVECAPLLHPSLP